MTAKRCLKCSVFLTLLLYASLSRAQTKQNQDLDRRFQAAVADYDAGRLAPAAAALEKLVLEVPESFEVHELLGLIYSDQSQDAKAASHFEKAVHLNPDSPEARTNYATNLAHAGRLDLAEVQFKRAVALQPRNYDANHDLGELYVQTGRIAAAVPYLEQAQRVNSSSYDNGYDLSLAYLVTGKLEQGRQSVAALLQQKDSPELHNLLGQIEEKDGNFVAAANQFELAAHADPSESNLFDWGCELLLHRTLDPAVEVFRQGSERYPNSPRLVIGLGMALYARGNYDDAVKALLRGADLNPSDPSCYLFLSKAFDSSPAQADDVIERFRRFAELQPNNARALYYYALSLWKGKREKDPNQDLHQIESLLKKSIALDPNIAESHLQVGNLYSDQNRFTDSIPEYVRARELDPELSDVRYRLGQAYVRTGQKELAQKEFEVYQKLREQHLAEIEKQRADIRQFVFSEKDSPSAKP
ncbi:MAG: tetratricopeptide repeat protein [Candidatus Acidiferrales bacterium]